MPLDLYAQSRETTNSKKAERYLQQAEYLRIQRQHTAAIEAYKNAINSDSKWIRPYVDLVEMYHAYKNIEEASRWIDKIYKGDVSEEVLQHIRVLDAELHINNGLYEEAKILANTYLNEKPQKKSYTEKMDQIVVNANFALEAIQNPHPIQAEALPSTINSEDLQYFPVLTIDQKQMVFTRMRPQGHFENIMTSYFVDGEWKEAQSISNNINTPDNEGACTLSADGRTLIFTSCHNRRKNYGRCDLYISRRVGNEWSEPENLGPNINGPDWESQPTLSADGRTLYFVSNRKGSIGERDIWYSTLDENDQWTPAKNVGTPINKKGDNISPFLHANGLTLFFASNRSPGFGGFDLWRSDRQSDGSWGEPVNLGYPINDHRDQVSLFITGDGKKAYYADERKTDAKWESSKIYTFDVPDGMSIDRPGNYVYGKVRDKTTREALPAIVELYDLKRDTLIARVKSDAVTGEYFMVLPVGSNYALYVEAQRYLFNSLNFNYSEKSDIEPIERNINLERLARGITVTLNNVFFETDSYSLEQSSKTELKQLENFLSKYPKAKVEILGHTDNTGSEEYNLQLSNKRALSVKEYLVEIGIDKERILTKGKGSSSPIGDNDTSSGRAQNRRIELKLL
ncbi:MAG: OmpA family protein [Cyclobacteriaceae bacterium]|nr:PD40 domain-containing protein [Cyclobacteriaceae bacterium]MCH8517129.1 OmpA family protein [Cyclobacteriaceae bacterium]